MYADKKDYQSGPSNYRGNRKSWPRMNQKSSRRTGSSAFLDKDGDADMEGGSGGGYRGGRGGRRRFNPGYNQGGRQYKRNFKGDWWKIMVYDADKFDHVHFFKMLDNTTNESIDPQGTRIEKNKLIFWLKNSRAKDAIRNQSGKLTLKDHTINLATFQSAGPEVQLTKDEKKAKICKALEGRFANTNTLKLDEFHKDPNINGFRGHLYETGSLVGELIGEKCPEMIEELDLSKNGLKHTGCLRQILTSCKILKRVILDNNYINTISDLQTMERNAPNLTHLSLVNNPVKNMLDDAQYISDIRKMFPKLIQLDNLPLPEKISFESEEQSTLPPAQKFSILLDPAPKSAVENFFLQFVKIHDSGSESRSQLSPAYDETCLFSIATSWRSRNNYVKDKFPIKMPSELLRRNRNFKMCNRAEQRESRLFIGRDNVIKELKELGESKHMLQTLNIDTSPMLNNHITAVLSGTIDSDHDYRTFSRTFILAANPANKSFLILNDQMSVIRASVDVVEKAQTIDIGNTASTSAAVPNPAVPTPAAPSNVLKQQLINNLELATNMTQKHVSDCLVAANWDYNKALSNFNDMKSKGQIPPDIFKK